jgi:hypothetical protein
MLAMRQVVDSNMLQKDELRNFLGKTLRNQVVLTDYAAMEAFKGDTLASIYKSMEIISEFPTQVIILKSTGDVCDLSGRRRGLQRRLIDKAQTNGFSLWCHRLRAAKNGDQGKQKQLLAKGREADQQLNLIMEGMKTYADNIEEAAKKFTANELKILRNKEPFTDEMVDKLLSNIFDLAERLFDDHPQIVELPPAEELPYSFIFRFAVCGYLLALSWIAVGGPKNVKLEGLRNDVVDANFAAFATYFDGLLTADAKAAQIYRDAQFLLEKGFLAVGTSGAPGPGSIR